MIEAQSRAGTLGRLLQTHRGIQLAEIAVVFAAGVGMIYAGLQVVGDNPILVQAVIWVANVVMLLLVWTGLWLRGQGPAHFGLGWGDACPHSLPRIVVLSLVVAVAALAGFVFGSIVGANLVGIPEPTDTSGYNFLAGNLPVLLISLLGVYIVSSFGEEVIYRAFLINRISEMGRGGRLWVVLAIITSSLMFGLAHVGWGPMGIIQTTFMGLALGLAYLKLKRNLWVLVLAHAYMDTVLFVQMYLQPA